MNIRIKRAYEAAADDDGYRILVDRVWPRGRSREGLQIDEWARDVAPRTEMASGSGAANTDGSSRPGCCCALRWTRALNSNAAPWTGISRSGERGLHDGVPGRLVG